MLSEAATHLSQEICLGEIFQTVFSIITFLITTYGCMCETERDYPFHRALKKPAPFQNDGHLRGLRASRPVSKDNCCSNAPGHFCSIPSHSLLQHNSCRGKERPLEKELLPQLGFSLGVTRSGDHSENTALSLN